MHRTAVVAVVALALLLLAGCEVSARVNIDVRDDGSGTVGLVLELDDDARRTAELTGGPIEEQVRLDDLRDAGWDVAWERPVEGAVLRLEKEFARPEDLGGVVAELSGPHGPLRDVALRRDVGFLETELEVTGTVDLTALETGIADDAELVAALASAGVDVDALDAQVTGRLADALFLEVAISLPGHGPQVHVLEPGTEADLATTATVRHWPRILLLLAGGGAAVAAVVVLVSGRQNRRRGTTA